MSLSVAASWSRAEAEGGTLTLTIDQLGVANHYIIYQTANTAIVDRVVCDRRSSKESSRLGRHPSRQNRRQDRQARAERHRQWSHAPVQPAAAAAAAAAAVTPSSPVVVISTPRISRVSETLGISSADPLSPGASRSATLTSRKRDLACFHAQR